MRTTKKITSVMSSIVMLFATMIILLTSCKKESAGEGSMAVKMTDAPGDYISVNVDIRSVEVHLARSGNEGEWIQLTTQSGVYDLLSLKDKVSVLIANHNAIPLGKITQVRLILGSNNSIVTKDSLSHPLETPSAEQTGLKINVNAELSEKYNLDVELDFDADKSIVMTDNGTFALKPVIGIKRIGFH